MAFKIGQRVHCISTSDLGTVKKGNVYTITEIRWSKDRNGSYGIKVKEAKTPDIIGYTGFIRYDRFRPLDYDFAERILQQLKPQKMEICKDQ